MKTNSLVGNHYELVREIGRGGMGVVWEARDLRLGNSVAIKLGLNWAHAEKARGRLLREVKLLSRLHHPHIVTAVDFGNDQAGTPYLVMELLEGESLSARLHDGQSMTPDQALALVFPILGALEHAHQRGIFHRDIKPSNLFLDQRSGVERVMLVDFGIARGVGDDSITSTGNLCGSPHYLAPELALGNPASAASDIWALGAVLFRLLSGTPPIQGDSAAAILSTLANGAEPSLASAAPRTPRALALAVDSALKHCPSRRHRSAASMARSLVEAAVSAGICLPADPDPVGLPGYPQWVLAAREHSTADLGNVAGSRASERESNLAWTSSSTRLSLRWLMPAIVIGVVTVLVAATPARSHLARAFEVGLSSRSNVATAKASMQHSAFAPTGGHSTLRIEDTPTLRVTPNPRPQAGAAPAPTATTRKARPLVPVSKQTHGTTRNVTSALGTVPHRNPPSNYRTSVRKTANADELQSW